MEMYGYMFTAFFDHQSCEITVCLTEGLGFVCMHLQSEFSGQTLNLSEIS